MTDNEIIKALECCSHRIGNLQCEHCPAYSIAQMCIEDLMSDALNLINRQKAEIERLQKEFDTMCFVTAKRWVKNAKSEAIKEFAERLKDEMRLEDDCRYDCMNCLYECKGYVPLIDKFVKERTEVQE